MDTKMWALTIDRINEPWDKTTGLRKQQVARPVLDPKNPADADQVLVKTRYAGFCGSDRGIWFRKSFGDTIHETLDQEKKDIRVTGHELLGEILAVGPEAERAFGYKVGEIVSTESHIICGTCYQCRHGDTHVCATDRIIGISLDGCFAEYVKLPARALWRTDVTRIRPEVAAVQEPFGNAVHACSKVDLKGRTVAIFGCGTIGLFAIAVARGMGAKKIIGIEPMAAHAEMAKKLGADVVVTPSPAKPGVPPHLHDAETVKAIRELTDGVGVDVALEMSGANAALNTAIASARRGGHVVMFGLKSGDAVIEKLDRVIMEGKTIHSIVGRQIFRTWEITKRLLESRDPNIHDLIWEVILKGGKGTIVPFAEYEKESFEKQMAAHPKVVFKF